MRALNQQKIDHERRFIVPLSALMGTYDLEALVIAAPAFAHWGSEEQRRGVADALRPYAGTHAVTGGWPHTTARSTTTSDCWPGRWVR
jgi:hypothetical protein